ncbi:hypothetical protein M3Y96_00111800 [Aphelenchoides besseyi]|nr:hypothetical protein M3Y96_00111800 [Aphelenchoides besseyi]
MAYFSDTSSEMRLEVTVLFLTQLVYIVQSSIFCPHPVYPSSDEEFVVASIQARQQRPTNEAYYRIAEDIEDADFKRKSARFRLMTTRDSTECPFRGCLSEIAPSEPKSHGTVLYQTSVIGKMIPPGFFAMDVAQRLYCVVTDGDCGATIPLYRHYRLSPTGIYHAYTVEADTTIEGYTKELSPLCYVWPKTRPNINVSDTPSTLIPSLNEILQRLAPKTTTVSTTTTKESKDTKDSTEEEIRQENLNIVKETKPTEVADEVEGSGADPEVKEKKVVTKTSKKVARDEKKKVVAQDEPKKSKKVVVKVEEKKSETKLKKQPEASKTQEIKDVISSSSDESKVDESPSDESNASDSSEVSAEDLLHPQKILHFESVNEPAKVDKVIITPRVEPKADDEMPKPATLMPNDSESVLTSDEDEERARELAKFNARKSGKEPIEVGEQQDEKAQLIKFEDS